VPAKFTAVPKQLKNTACMDGGYKAISLFCYPLVAPLFWSSSPSVECTVAIKQKRSPL